MWPFSSTKPEKPPVSGSVFMPPPKFLDQIVIEDPKLQLELREMIDASSFQEGISKTKQRFLLWNRIAEVYPQVKDGGKWSFDCSNNFIIVLVKENPDYSLWELKTSLYCGRFR